MVATQIDLEIANAALQYRQGHFEQAIEWAERAAAHALARGERMRMAHAYYIEYVARLFGPGNVSNSRRDEAIAILEEAGELVRLASALNNKGSRLTTKAAGTRRSNGFAVVAKRASVPATSSTSHVRR